MRRAGRDRSSAHPPPASCSSATHTSTVTAPTAALKATLRVSSPAGEAAGRDSEIEAGRERLSHAIDAIDEAFDRGHGPGIARLRILHLKLCASYDCARSAVSASSTTMNWLCGPGVSTIVADQR